MWLAAPGSPIGCRFCASGIGEVTRDRVGSWGIGRVWQVSGLTLCGPTTLEAAIKTVLFLAALIVLASYTAVIAGAGVRAGRAREAAARNGISPQWAKRCEDFLHAVVSPPQTEAELDDMVVLPDPVKEAAKKLLYEAPGAAERRADRRRRGY